MRKSGILLHISSLPSKYGIGTLGIEAYKFIDFLNKAKVRVWQILPTTPTSFGDSPYQSLASFANNPYFIDLDMLVEDGLLNINDLTNLENPKNVDYGYLYETRYDILRKAFKNFDCENNDFKQYCLDNAYWIYDYSMFMSLKKFHKDACWLEWKEKYKYNDQEAILQFLLLNYVEVNFWKFVQYMYHVQWNKLKAYASLNEVEIMGDMPIYVALDSVDVWSNPKNFLLDEDLVPSFVAGVPPDYFSETGQLWGNPVYDYQYMESNNYSWWVSRVKRAFEMYDYVRIDHFRGFASYYVIEANEKTAINGKWVKGPGVNLFNAIKNSLGDKQIIAEDLGILTDDVFDLLNEVGFPGMRVLQFAFDKKLTSIHLPHNYTNNCICYTGTHDNMTLKEWILSLSLDELSLVCSYLGFKSGSTTKILNSLITLAMMSVASICIIPLTDYLMCNGEARFNNPSTIGTNWSYRIKGNDLKETLAKKICTLVERYSRY